MKKNSRNFERRLLVQGLAGIVGDRANKSDDRHVFRLAIVNAVNLHLMSGSGTKVVSVRGGAVLLNNVANEVKKFASGKLEEDIIFQLLVEYLCAEILGEPIMHNCSGCHGGCGETKK